MPAACRRTDDVSSRGTSHGRQRCDEQGLRALGHGHEQPGEACDSEADALAFVRAYVAEHDSEYPTSWALLWDDDAADQAGQIAEGSALLARAEAASRA